MVLAWIIPGAGHVYLGRKVRGVILFVTITSTFWAGIAIGGVMTVDSRYESWWFAAQSLTGVNGLVSWYRQDAEYKALAKDSKNRLFNTKSTGRPGVRQLEIDHKFQQKGLVLATPGEGIARAYTGIAGMLNLLCIFDAALLGMMGVGGEPKRDETPQDSADGKEKT